MSSVTKRVHSPSSLVCTTSVPFEIEIAEFVGKVNCLIYDNVGKFSADELGEKEGKELDKDEREKRLQAFLEIFLTPSYVLPKRTNSLNIPDYILALIALSKAPAPVYQYLDFDFSKSMPDVDKLKELTKREDIKTIVQEYLIIDYSGSLPKIEGLEKVSVKDAISKITRFLL